MSTESTQEAKLLIDPETKEVYLAHMYEHMTEDDLSKNENALNSQLNDIRVVREYRDSKSDTPSSDINVPTPAEAGNEPLPAPEVAQPQFQPEAPAPEAAPATPVQQPVPQAPAPTPITLN